MDLIAVGSLVAAGGGAVIALVASWLAAIAHRRLTDRDAAALLRAMARAANSPNGGTIYLGVRKPHPLILASARGITGLAVMLAGRGRQVIRDEWRCHLAGETGLGLPDKQRIRAARGFLRSALRYRLADAADLGWNLADLVLRSRTLSNLFVLVPTTGMAVFIFLHEGTLGVMKAMESIGTTGGLFYGLVRIGRWWRDVKPADPEPRAKE